MSGGMLTALHGVAALTALAVLAMSIRLGRRWVSPGQEGAGLRASEPLPRAPLAAMVGLALVLLLVGEVLGLVWAPPDREMGDVYRIIYVHVPAMWMAMLMSLLNFACCLSYLFNAGWRKDALAETSAEIGLLFGTFGLVLGALWGRPTWGVYWDWDPRLTSMAIMLVTYTAYLALRRFVEDPEKRAVWSSVVGIISFVNVPIVWFSVKWWRSLHQVQSTPKTVDPEMTLALRFNAWAFLALLAVFVLVRYRIALATREEEVALPEALPSDAPGARTSEVA
jgi:heme exporter protein C